MLYNNNGEVPARILRKWGKSGIHIVSVAEFMTQCKKKHGLIQGL